MSNFPYICECGYNTMNTQRAYTHAQAHYRQEIKTNLSTTLEHMKQNANGRMIYLCVNGYELDAPSTVTNHGTPFYLSESELSQGQGICSCEYCESECVRLDN